MATVERINEALSDRGIAVGTTRVVAVRVRLRPDPSGDDAIIVKLVLADPPEGFETWPVEDLWTIRELTNQAIREADPEGTTPWIISFEAEHPEEFDPEDAAGEIQIDL